MYRHGFGDCFLLSFWRADERVFSMLVDCGIKKNTKSDTVPIKDVINDLKKTLAADSGRPVIDVLVATHEHWDHVAYFHPTDSPDFFKDFDIGQVWLAWTEDPKDEEAVTINSRLREGAAALHLAVARLHDVEAEETNQFNGLGFGSNMAAARASFNAALNDVLGFYGAAVAKKSKTSQSGIRYKPNGEISVETEVAMSNVVALGKKGGVVYLNPGKTVDDGLVPPGVSVYVLGPPRGSLINKMNPSKGAAKETYLGIDHTGLTGFIDAVVQFDAAGKMKGAARAIGPFSADTGISAAQAKNNPFFKMTYFAKGEEHRRIDHTWLDAVSQFSLQLDGAINNTSLVLAIELQESGSVLLFPGDAQVGSWLSCHDLEWKVKRNGKMATVTAADLLKNTVLYKVSHHGSHNATVKDKGLELMTHQDLVAMIPEKEKSYNGILYKPLIDHLRTRCKGRVIVSADVKYPPEKLLKTRPAELSAAEWNAFKADLTITDLYVEYTVR